MLTPMEKLTPLAPLNAGKEQKGKDASSSVEGSIFGTIFRSAIDNVKETDAEAREAQYLLATGQRENPAQLGIAADKNEVAVDLLVQMRNKALEAYNELKNMSV